MYEIGLGNHIRRMITASDILSLGLSEQELRRHFPPLASTIADSIGTQATITLILQFGGNLIYIPAKMRPSHRIAKAIGLRSAERLSEDFGNPCGTNITLPNSLNGKLLRRALAIKLFREGRSLSQVALATGVARSTVVDWKKRYFLKENGSSLYKADFEAASKPVERVITLSPSLCASAPETASGDQ